MSKITLSDVSTISGINTNFQLLEDELNNKVLYRNNPVNEPNTVESQLDMNGERIINLPAPIADNEPIRLQDFREGQPESTGAVVLRSDLGNTSDTTKGDALIGVKQPYTGSVARTQHTKNQEEVSVLDFGAVGDDVTDDLPAFLTAAAAVNGPVIVPPNHSYKLSTSTGNFKYGGGYYDRQESTDAPSTTIQVSRDISSTGTTASQTGGFIVYNEVQAGVTHHEFGMFSVLNNRATSTTNEPVAFYAQANSLGNGASPLWAGVMEVGNIRPDGTKTTASSVLAGIEVDVNNWFAFDASLKKLGIVCIARGGGECNEAFAVRSELVPPGGGFFSGYWRTGYWIQGQALNPTLGTGLFIESDHNEGVTITGKSTSFGINLAGSAASATGIRISSNYATAMIVPPDRKILLNDIGNVQGISYVSATNAITFDSSALSLVNHTTSLTASAGGAGALPATASGYISVVINGVSCKIPFYGV